MSSARLQEVMVVTEGDGPPALLGALWDPPRFALGLDRWENEYTSAAARLSVASCDGELTYVVMDNQGRLAGVNPPVEGVYTGRSPIRLEPPTLLWRLVKTG